MSRRNRNNNRYNSRNRNQWDEGLDDYFDEDEQLESEEEDSSEDQDEYEEDEYEEYEDEQSDEEDPDEEDYDEDEEYDEEEEYDEDESDEEVDEDEQSEEDEEDEYDEEEYDEEESDEEDEYDEDEEDEEDDELESEIDAAAESTAKKTIGNSDLLSKLRGQMRPQINEESSESSNDVDINISPLSLFGQPISQTGKTNNSASSKEASNAPHANAKIVQSVTVGSKQPAPVQKSGSGRVITAQSQNGASVSSVQPRNLEAEKAEAERKQKEKERLEEEQKVKEEKSARVLDKFKGKKTSAVKSTKAGATWLWSKISSGAAWIWAGIAACFIWIVTSPKRAWQTWRIFNRSWWAGLGSGVWNAMKKPFVKAPSAVAEADGESAVPSGSEPASASLESEPATVSRKRQSRKKNVDIWDAESPASSSDASATDAFASKETDSRRRLYLSLSSIGAAAVVFLLVLPSLLNGSKKVEENAVAVNEQTADSAGQNNASDVPIQNVGNSGSTDAAVSNAETLKLTSSSSKTGTPSLMSSDLKVQLTDSGKSASNSGAPDLGSRQEAVGSSNSPSANSTPLATGADRVGSQLEAGSAADRVGSQLEAGNAENGSFGDITSSTRPRGSAHGSFGDKTSSTRPYDSAPDDYRSSSPRNVPQTYDGSQRPYDGAQRAYDNSPRMYNDNEPLTPPDYTDNLPPSTYGETEQDIAAPEIPAPEIPDLDASVPETPVPEVTELEAPEIDDSLANPVVPDIETPDLPTQEETGLKTPELDAPAPALDMTVPEPSTDEVPVPDDIEADVPVPELSEDDVVQNEDVKADQTEVVKADDSDVDLATPAIPDLEADPVADPLNGAADEAPEAPTPDLTANTDTLTPPDIEPEDDVPQTPDLTAPAQPSDVTPDLTVPDSDLPDVTMPDLSDVPSVDSNPIEEPTAPEPTIPEPTIPEPNPIETGIASQPTQPAPPADPIPVPEDNATDRDALIASNPPEETPSTPQESAVALGTPGPLVSSANTGSSNLPAANSTPLATRNSQLATFDGASYNSAYAYNSSGVYTVQPNDSFWTIAKRIYGSGEYARALAQYNSSRVSPQSLTASVQIMTPPPETLQRQFPELCPVRTASSAPAQPTSSAPAGTRVYIVDQEESVMEIARRELGSILYCSQVYALNQDLLSGSVDRVKPGVRLLLPVKN